MARTKSVIDFGVASQPRVFDLTATCQCAVQAVAKSVDKKAKTVTRSGMTLAGI